MRYAAFLLAMLVLPAIVMADGLATSVCVLDKAEYEKLAKEYGETAKIPTEVLWNASVLKGCFLKESCDATFEREGESYRLLASRQGTGEQAIYSISQEVKGKASRLVCVGTVGLDEVKKDRENDRYVVVLRAGNFEKQ
jgi:hypothetical protein